MHRNLRSLPFCIFLIMMLASHLFAGQLLPHGPYTPPPNLERGMGNVVLQWEVDSEGAPETLDGFNIAIIGDINDLDYFEIQDITGAPTFVAGGNVFTGNTMGGNIEFLVPPIPMAPGNVFIYELFAHIKPTTALGNIQFIIDPPGIYSANAFVGSPISSGPINFVGGGNMAPSPFLEPDPTFPVPPSLPTNANVPGLAFYLDTQNTGYNGNLIRLEYELHGADANNDFLHYTLFDGIAGSNIFVAGNALTGNVIGGNVVFDNIWLPMTSSQNTLIGLFVETPSSFVSSNVEFVIKPENILVEFTSVAGGPIFGGVAPLGGGNMGGGNLIGYWPMDDGSGSFASDISGTANPANFDAGSPVWAPGLGGNTAIQLDGISDYLTIDDIPAYDNLSQVTFAAWIYKTANGQDVILASNQYSESQSRFQFNSDDFNKVSLVLSNNGSGATSLTGSTNISIGEWNHVAGTWDGSTMRVYLNGQLDGTQAFAGPIFNGNGNLHIGATLPNYTTGAFNFFGGNIQDLRFYNRALCQPELQAIHDQFAPMGAGVSLVSTSFPTPSNIGTNLENVKLFEFELDNMGGPSDNIQSLTIDVVSGNAMSDIFVLYLQDVGMSANIPVGPTPIMGNVFFSGLNYPLPGGSNTTLALMGNTAASFTGDNLQFEVRPESITLDTGTVMGGPVNSGFITLSGGGNVTPPHLVDDFGFTAPANLMTSTGPTAVLTFFLDTQNTGYNGTLTDLQFDIFGADPGMELAGALIYDLGMGNVISNSPSFSANNITFNGLSWPLSSAANLHMNLKVTTNASFVASNIQFDLQPSLVTLADNAVVTGTPLSSGVVSLMGGGGSGPFIKHDIGFTPPGVLGTNLIRQDVFAFELDTVSTGYSGNLTFLEFETFSANPATEFTGFTLFDVTMGTNVALGANIIGGNIVFPSINVPLSGGSNTVLALQVDTGPSFVSDNIEIKLYPMGLGFADNVMAQGSFVSYGPISLAGGNMMMLDELSIHPSNGFTPPGNISRGTIDNIVMEIEVFGGANVEVIDGITFDVFSDINDLTQYELIDISGNATVLYTGFPGSGNAVGGNISFFGNPIVVMPGNGMVLELKVDVAGSTASDNVDIILNPWNVILAGGNMVAGNQVDYGPIALIGGGNMAPLGFLNLDPFNGESNYPVSGNHFIATFEEPIDLMAGNIDIWENGNVIFSYNDLSAEVMTVGANLEIFLPGPLTPSSSYYILVSPNMVAGNISGNVFGGFNTPGDWAFTTGSGNAGNPSPLLKPDLGFTPPGMIGTSLFEAPVFAFELDTMTEGFSGNVSALEFMVFNADPSVEFTGYNLYDVTGTANVSNMANVISGNIVFAGLNIPLSGGMNTILELQVNTGPSFVSDNVEFAIAPPGIVLGGNAMAGGNFVSYGPIPLAGGNMGGNTNFMIFNTGFAPPMSVPSGNISPVMEFVLEPYSSEVLNEVNVYIPFGDGNDLAYAELFHVEGGNTIASTNMFGASAFGFNGLGFGLSAGINVTLQIAIDPVMTPSMSNIELSVTPFDIGIGANLMVGGDNIYSGIVEFVGGGNMMGPNLWPDPLFMNPGSLGTNLVEEPVFAFEIDTTSMGYSGNIVYLEFDVFGADPNIELTGFSLYDVNMASNIMGMANVIAGNIVFNMIDIPLSGGTNSIIELRVDTPPTFGASNIEFGLEPHNVGTGAMDPVGGTFVAYGPIPLGGGNMMGPNLWPDPLFMNPGSLGTNLVEEPVFAFEIDTTSMGYSGNIVYLEFDVAGADPNIELTGFSLYDVNMASNIMGMANVIAGNIVFNMIDIPLSGGTNSIIELRVDTPPTFGASNIEFGLEPHNVGTGSMDPVGGTFVAYGPIPLSGGNMMSGNVYLLASPNGVDTNINPGEPDRPVINFRLDSMTDGVSGVLEAVEFRVLAGDATIGTDFTQYRLYENTDGFIGSSTTVVNGNIVFTGLSYAFNTARNWDFDLTVDAGNTFTNSTFQLEVHASDIVINGGMVPVVGAPVSDPAVTLNTAVNNFPSFIESSPQNVAMDQDGNPTPFSLVLNATDPDGDVLTWSVSFPASNGTAMISGTGNSQSIGYMPDMGYTGSDSFGVAIDDGNGGSASLTVNVTVNPPPAPDVIIQPAAGFMPVPSVTAGNTEIVLDFDIFASVNTMMDSLTFQIVSGNIDDLVDVQLWSTSFGDSRLSFGSPAGNSLFFGGNGMMFFANDNLNFQLRVNVPEPAAGTDFELILDPSDSMAVSFGGGNQIAAGLPFGTGTVSINSVPMGPMYRHSTMGAGRGHIVAMAIVDERAYSIGRNDQNQLGRLGDPMMNGLIAGSANVVDISVGDAHGLILRDDGMVLSFGSGAYGQVAGGIESGYMGTAVDTEAGAYSSFVITDNNQLWAKGRNHKGQLGIGSTADAMSWTQVTLPAGNIQEVAAGIEHTLVLIDGRIYGFGSNGYGQLSQAGSGFHPSAVGVNVNPVWLAIEAGGFTSLALDMNGDLWAGGRNNRGQLGLGFTSPVVNPPSAVTINMPTGVISSFAAGVDHSVLVMENMGNTTVYAVGSNREGQVPVNSYNVSLGFQQISDPIINAKEVECGPYTTIIQTINGISFGSGQFGSETRRTPQTLMDLRP